MEQVLRSNCGITTGNPLLFSSSVYKMDLLMDIPVFCVLFVFTWAKYSSAILPAHSRQRTRGRAGLLTSAHLISILLMTTGSIETPEPGPDSGPCHQDPDYNINGDRLLGIMRLLCKKSYSMILLVIFKRIGEQFVLTRCTGGCCILNGLNLTDELVDMEEMLAHVGGQHHVDEAGPDRLVDLGLESRQDVDPGVAVGQLEAQGAVVILQHRGVIVQDGQL